MDEGFHADADPLELFAALEERRLFLAERGLITNRVTEAMAVNAAAVANRFPDMAPALFAPVVISGIAFDAPGLLDLVMADELQINLEENVGPLTRAGQWAMTGLMMPIDTLQKIGNTFTKTLQGQNINDAWRESGSSLAAEAIQQQQLHPDRPLNFGSSPIFLDSTMPWEHEGFLDAYEINLADLKGNVPDSEAWDAAMQLTTDQFVEKIGAPITQLSERELHSTTIRKTLPDGRTAVSHYSPARMALQPFVGKTSPFTGQMIEPGTDEYETVANWGDLGADVIFDPWNAPLLRGIRARAASRKLPPQQKPPTVVGAATPADVGPSVVGRTDESVRIYKGRGLSKHQYDTQKAHLEKMINELSPKYADQIPGHEKELAALEDAWATGDVVAGPGAGGIPSAPPGKAKPVAGMSRKEWDALADDDWVEVTHVTTKEQAAKFTEKGVIGDEKAFREGADIRSERGQTGRGLYVGSDAEQLKIYHAATLDAEVGKEFVAIKIRVRKKDLLTPPEVSADDVFKALKTDRFGAVILDDIPVGNIDMNVPIPVAQAAPPGPSASGASLKQTIGRTYKPWYRPQGDWYINDPQGRSFSEFLTGSSSVDDIMEFVDPRFVDPQDIALLARNTDPAMTDAIMTGGPRPLTEADIAAGVTEQVTGKPYLGTVMTNYGGSGGISQGLRRLQTDPVSGAKVYKHPWWQGGDEHYLGTMWEELGGEAMLDGADIPATVRSVQARLKVVGVPKAERDKILLQILEHDGVTFIMQEKVIPVVQAAVERALVAQGWEPGLAATMFTKMNKLWKGSQSYSREAMGNPMSGNPNRRLPGRDRVITEKGTRKPTLDELAPDGKMKTSDLVQARKAADKAGDKALRKQGAGVVETKVANGKYSYVYGGRKWTITKNAQGKWVVAGSEAKGATFNTKKAALEEINKIVDTVDEGRDVQRALGESLTTEGFNEPVKVEWHPASGQYRVVDGNKRVLAAQAQGIEDIPVEIVERGKRIVGQKGADEAIDSTNTLGAADDIGTIKTRREPGEPIESIEPLLESELMGDIAFMPTMRQLRTLRSPARKLRNTLDRTDRTMSPSARGGWINGKLHPAAESRASQMAGTTLSFWRQIQLATVNWFMNVFPDEMLRAAAAGYVTPFNHPFQYFSLAWGGRGDVMLSGDSIRDSITYSDTGAGWVRDYENVTRYGVANPNRRAGWVPTEYGQPGYYDGLADQIIHQNVDELTSLVLTRGRQNTYDWLTSPEGKETLDRIVGKAREKSRLKAITDPKELAIHLERVEVLAHQSAGGYWVGLDIRADKPGFVDSFGNSVPKPAGWDDTKQYMVVVRGEDEILDIIGTGSRKTGNDIIDVDTGVVMPEMEPILGRVTTPKPTKAARQTNEQVDNLKRILGEHGDKFDEAMAAGVTDAKQLPRVVFGVDPDLVARLKPTMFDALMDNVFHALGTFPTHRYIRDPFFRQRYFEELARAYLDATPSARAGIDNVVDLKSEGWGFTMRPMFNKYLDEAAAVRPKDYPNQNAWDNIDDIDEYARAVGLDDTKALFYELGNVHNIADMTRHIAVFAEAFYEILTTWAKLLSPVNPRGVYNWEKIRIAGDFANQQGWFGQNEFGEQRFNYPSAGLGALLAGQELLKTGSPESALTAGVEGAFEGIDTGPNSRIQPTVSPTQALSNPVIDLGLDGERSPLGTIRSLLIPGATPWVSLGLPLIQSMLPEKWEKPFQLLVKGNYPIDTSVEGALMSAMPSTLRKTLALLLPENLEMSRRVQAETATTFLEALALSGQIDLASEEGLKEGEERVLNGSTTLTVARMIDGLTNPESPQYDSQVLVDYLNAGATEFVNAAVVGQARRWLQEMTGDNMVTALIMEQQFGISREQLGALDIPKNATIYSTPMDFNGYVFWEAEENQEFITNNRFIAGLFSPKEEDDFYNKAWDNAQKRGDVVSLDTGVQIARLSNGEAHLIYANELVKSLQRRDDGYAAQPSYRWPLVDAAEDAYMRQVASDLESVYPHYSRDITGSGAKFTPGPQRPRLADFLEDVDNIITFDEGGNPLIDPHALRLNPDFSFFLLEFASLRYNNNAISESIRQVSPTAWENSRSLWAMTLKNEGLSSLRAHIDTARRQGVDVAPMITFMHNVVEPLFGGADPQTPVFYDAFDRPIAYPEITGGKPVEVPVG